MVPLRKSLMPSRGKAGAGGEGGTQPPRGLYHGITKMRTGAKSIRC